MQYYTISSEYLSEDKGNCRAISITKATSESAALSHFQSIFGFNASTNAFLREGINIDNQFCDLLTENAKKVIVKIISGSNTAPTDFTYSNKIFLKYEE